MTGDTEILKLFSTAKTEFEDNEEFINSLSARLDKLEYIKRMQEEKLRNYKTGILAAFISGVILGCMAIAAIAYMPTDAEILCRVKDFGISISDIKWISSTTILLFIGGCAICIASSVQDISSLKASASKL